MSFEIEAKLRVDSHEPTRKALVHVGATFLAEVIETDRLFDRRDKELRRSGVGLRLRETKVLRGDRDVRVVLTVKGPMARSQFKSREEIEIAVDGANDIARMLELLGFSVMLTYQKRRELWSYRECVVSLDSPPHIGLFVEIEAKTEERVYDVRKDLGLEHSMHVSTSYVALMDEYCEAHGVKDYQVLLPGLDS